ncbi:hypothetical protein BJ165DRAFT_1486848 [Panaeolus papilionaceus]|nr:hypothetical protein BJ165DRAFT_1486848 [Panaeolus papilionaceus]
MAKLARTLGENLPPEFVFGHIPKKGRGVVACGRGVMLLGVDGCVWCGWETRVREKLSIVKDSVPKAHPAVSATSSTSASSASTSLTITVSREIETSKYSWLLNMASRATSL